MQHLQPNTTLQGGKYRIERVLGQGGFGITYLAVQTTLNRYVAIKEFFMKHFCNHDEVTQTMQTSITGGGKMVELYRKKFIKEAKNLAKLHHPNIINVIEVFEENGTVYYSMPFLSGGSLQDYVDRCGALSEVEAMKYVKQIAGALKYMHEEQHICHYDVKPANILLDGKGNAVLIDFGISKNYDAEGHETTTTPIGLSEGYAPIEQYQQDVEEFSPASDVYALGATLYFLLHGKRPVSAAHRASGISLLMNSHLSQGVKDIINASMKVSKTERARSVDVFIGNAPAHRKYYGWILIISLIIIGIGIGVYYMISQINEPQEISSESTSETTENTNAQLSIQSEPVNEPEPQQKGSETFIVEGIKGEKQEKYKQTYTIKVDDGNVSWTFKDAKETRKGTFKCNPLIDAEIIIAECKSVIYWWEASSYFWFLAEELGFYRYDEFQLGKKALGLSASYMGQARKTCPEAFEHVNAMYQDLVNNENGGDIWDETCVLSYALGEHPLEPCDLYDYSFY